MRFFRTILLTACAVWAVSCNSGMANGTLSLDIDDSMEVLVSSSAAQTPLIGGAVELSEIEIGGKTVEFADSKAVRSKVNDKFGEGERLTFKSGSSDIPGLVREVRVTSYADFPSTVIVSATYTNGSDEVLVADGWSQCGLSVADNGDSPAFWSFQGQSTGDRTDWLASVDGEFYQQNFMGMNNSDYGGGIPVVAVWRRDAGVMIGHLAPTPQLVSLPVSKKADEGNVNIAIEKEFLDPVEIAPGESLETYDCFITTFTGDCFSAFRNYAGMLEKVGVVMPESEPDAFETAWCAWGYERKFTIDEIIGTLPKVKELGFKWATLDDGYQIAEGDWDLTTERFPRGDEDMKFMVDKFHEYGLKAELWWAPLAADPGTQFLKDYPESVILDKDGKPQDITWWDSWYLSPIDEDVVREQGNLVKKFIGEYGFDGLKLDGQHMNSVAPDYNPAHHPEDPEKDVRELPSFFKMVFETARAIKPSAVLQYCPCGDCFSVYNLPYTNKTVSSDPLSSWQIRTKGYILRAIAPKTAYYGDHIELSEGECDYPTQLGIGAVIGTKFTWPADNPYVDHSYLLTPEKEEMMKNALAIYEDKKLSTGELVGDLYDVGYDYPETYVIRKNGNTYYAFYTHPDDERTVSSVELRGLEAGKKYAIEDYYRHVGLGEIVASENTVLDVPVDGYLLIEAREL